MGIEPTLSAWEAEVLPLNYTREHAKGLILTHKAILHKMSPMELLNKSIKKAILLE